jgi:hypothetical protein
MPKRSDCPYPEVVCSEIHDAATLERYQCITCLSDYQAFAIMAIVLTEGNGYAGIEAAISQTQHMLAWTYLFPS